MWPAGISITGTGNYIQIRHNKIHNINNGENGALGLAVYGTNAPSSINNLIIDGNELYGLVLGDSESLTLNGNVQFWSVTNNVVRDNNNIGIDAAGFWKVAPNPAYDQARDGYIGGNVVYNIHQASTNGADGIYVDGGTRITIEKNIIHNCDIGLEAASENPGRTSSYVTARSNLIFLNLTAGVSLGGYSTGVGSTDHTTVVNNTLFHNDTSSSGSGELLLQYFPDTVSSNTFDNNIVAAGPQGLLIGNDFSDPVVSLDNNLYYAPNGNPNNNTWMWANATYQKFSAYKAASGNDSTSSFANPQFVNLIVPILWVQSTSPAINAGTNLGTAVVGTQDVAGFPRVQGADIDIGAYEQG